MTTSETARAGRGSATDRSDSGPGRLGPQAAARPHHGACQQHRCAVATRLQIVPEPLRLSGESGRRLVK